MILFDSPKGRSKNRWMPFLFAAFICRVPSHSLLLNPGLPTVAPNFPRLALATSVNVPTSSEGKEKTREQEKKCPWEVHVGLLLCQTVRAFTGQVAWRDSPPLHTREERKYKSLLDLSACQYFILLVSADLASCPCPHVTCSCQEAE